MDPERSLREHLARLLDGRQAHVDFDTAVEGLTAAVAGRRPAGAPHSAWELLEHMRIAQWDILEFSRDPSHVSPPFPEGYWPESAEPASEAALRGSIAAFRSDREAMKRLVLDPKTDLFTPLAHGQGQTILREALLVADHNAYHLGQLVLVRRLAGDWRPESSP